MRLKQDKTQSKINFKCFINMINGSFLVILEKLKVKYKFFKTKILYLECRHSNFYTLSLRYSHLKRSYLNMF